MLFLLFSKKKIPILYTFSIIQNFIFYLTESKVLRLQKKKIEKSMSVCLSVSSRDRTNYSRRVCFLTIWTKWPLVAIFVFGKFLGTNILKEFGGCRVRFRAWKNVSEKIVFFWKKSFASGLSGWGTQHIGWSGEILMGNFRSDSTMFFFTY